MNKDITLEDLGWNNIELENNMIRITYIKLYEFADNEKDLKERLKKAKKAKFICLHFNHEIGKLISKDINFCGEEKELEFEKEEIFIKGLGKPITFSTFGFHLSPLDIQAIYNKCKELGWFDD